MPLVKKSCLARMACLAVLHQPVQIRQTGLAPCSKQEVLEWHMLSLASVSSTKFLLQEKASEFDDIDATVEIDDGESLQ